MDLENTLSEGAASTMQTSFKIENLKDELLLQKWLNNDIDLDDYDDTDIGE